MPDDNRYKIGEIYKGMMPIADVTTDREVGCLAVGTIQVAGPSIEISADGKEREELLLEPLDLYYVSYRTGQWTPLWEYKENVTGKDSEREKKTVIKKFRKLNSAELGDIDKKLKLFKSNQYYKMAPEELGRFEQRLDPKHRPFGKLLSERESPGTRSVIQRERLQMLFKAVENDKHFQNMKNNAGCN